MNDQQQNIQEVVQQALQNMQGTQTSWQGQSISTMPEIQKVNIPIKLQTQQGSLRVYFEFDASWGASAQKLQELVDTLESMGFPLDIWQPKGSGWGNNSGYSSNYKRSGGYRRY